MTEFEEKLVTKIPWWRPLLLLFVPLLIPSGLAAQTQDIHALRVVTQAFEKAKRDDKIKRNDFVTYRIHLIENLNAEGKFESKEKEATFKIYARKNKSVEELVNVWPLGAEPPKSPVDFDKLLDAFLSRFYFSVSQDEEEIDGQKHYKIHFWPKEDLPTEKEYVDYILNRIAGIIYIDKRTYMVREIKASLTQNINVRKFWYSWYVDKFDLEVNFKEWRGLGLLKKLTATARYSYRKFIGTTYRYQTHILSFKYDVK